MAQIPVLKLTALFVKTIAKPVTSLMKSEASKHPNFSKFCAGIGQLQHRVFSRINVLTSGYKFVGVKPLEHDVALSKGVELLSEFMVITISGGIILVEFWRSEKKSALKNAQAAEKEARLQQELDERLAFVEGRLHGIEMFMDDQSKAKLKAWQAEHLEADVARILKRNQAIASASKDTTVMDRIGNIPLQHQEQQRQVNQELLESATVRQRVRERVVTVIQDEDEAKQDNSNGDFSLGGSISEAFNVVTQLFFPQPTPPAASASSGATGDSPAEEPSNVVASRSDLPVKSSK